MARDDSQILEVKAKPKANHSASSRLRTGGSYKSKRPSSAHNPSKSRSAREMWLDTVKSGSGALSSGRKSGQHPGKRTPTEYWIDTLRKTGEGISTESKTMQSLSGSNRPPDMAMPFLSTSHYLRQVTLGSEKTPRKSHDTNSRPPPGRPAYKSQEEYYEEILALRKQIASLGNDNSMMKSRLRRTEEDNTKKEKEIEKLLDPSKSEEMRRTLTDRRPDTGSVIHSLKQKIVRLEQQLKDKEASYKKLESDIKATRIDEMKVQLQAFYTEIVRLQQTDHTAQTTKAKAGTHGKPESKETAAKIRALNETILRMNESNIRLHGENTHLKEDLAKFIEETQVNVDMVDGAKQEYVDMNKRQLIGVVAKLEKKIEKMDNDSVLLLSDLDRRRDGKVEGKILLSGSLNERIDQLDKRETELLEERMKLQESLKKTNDDRIHYKKECTGFEKDVKELKKELNKHRTDTDILDGMSRRSGVGRHSITSDTSTRAATVSRAPVYDDLERERKLEDLKQQRAARVLQKSWRKHNVEKTEEDDEAASLIQSTLRGHHTRKDRANQLRNQLDRPESRASHPDHHSRRPDSRASHSDTASRRPDSRASHSDHHSRRPIDSESLTTDDVSIDDDVITLQSVFRGHMGRKDGRRRQGNNSPTSVSRRQGNNSPTSVSRRPGNNSPTSVNRRPSSSKTSKRDVNDLDSEGESIEDDSILARAMTPRTARATNKRPSSAIKRPSGVFSSPRRRSPLIRQLDEDEDDDDIVF